MIPLPLVSDNPVEEVLYRGADLAIAWPLLAAMAAIGSVYFAFALSRFRRVIFGS